MHALSTVQFVRQCLMSLSVELLNHSICIHWHMERSKSILTSFLHACFVLTVLPRSYLAKEFITCTANAMYMVTCLPYSQHVQFEYHPQIDVLPMHIFSLSYLLSSTDHWMQYWRATQSQRTSSWWVSVSKMLPCVLNKFNFAFQEEVGVETDEEYGVTIPS